MKTINASYEIVGKEKIDGMEILKEIEAVGRTCYKSESNITGDSAKKFVAMLIEMGHEAMIEHNVVSVRFICDRGISHELVRHRLASFGRESTRYCNYAKEKFGNSITFVDITEGIKLDTKMNNLESEQISAIYSAWYQGCMQAEYNYLKLIELGATPQIARSVLPSSTKTEIIVSMNLREWSHFFSLRADKPAHPQMREITIPLLKEMSELIPIVFDDLAKKFIQC